MLSELSKRKGQLPISHHYADNPFCNQSVLLKITTHPAPANRSARPFVAIDLDEALAIRRGMALRRAADANMAIFVFV